ncbi:MAG TPA: M24 family metallopeptidase, partial [Stellaceae bacterium]|nr:M24 family metallopeptidase [Stellaceae bacterium]
ERLCNPIPRGELERRWKAVRAAMAEAGLDALVVQGMSNLAGTGGYFRWFTGIPAMGSYPMTIVFPRDGLMTLVMHGAFGGDSALDDRDPMLPGVGRCLTTPSFPAIAYTIPYDAELVAGALVRGGHRKIGVVAPNNMYHGFGSALREKLGSQGLADATALVDPIKAVKSAEEIGFIRRAAAMQDELLADARAKIRPGLRDFEVMCQSQYQGQLRGSETGYFLGSSAPPDEPAFIRPRPQQGRTLRAGDVLFWQAENTGPGGFFVHVGRVIVLGKAPQELADAFGLAVEAQDFTLKLLKPGARASEVFAEYQAWLRARRIPEETRLHCHGQGYDVVERPLIRSDETMTLAANMNIGLHPSWSSPRFFVTVCDNFLIGPDGAVERLHKSPREIIEL